MENSKRTFYQIQWLLNVAFQIIKVTRIKGSMLMGSQNYLDNPYIEKKVKIGTIYITFLNYITLNKNNGVII